MRNILTSYESEQLEIKRSTAELDAGLRTYAAMLNGRLPGFVVFGVTNNGDIVGQDVASATLEKIAGLVGARIEPLVFPEIETVALDSGKVAVVLRVSGGTGLYTYEGRPYQRVGATTQRMPQSTFERRLLERMHATSRWEDQMAEGLSLGDLDTAEITRTVDEAIRRQRLDDPGTRDPLELLLGLGLVNDGDQLLNAALVLFGRPDRLASRYPQCLMRMARFRGTTKDEFIDNRQEIANAFDLFVRGQRFLRDHLPVAGRIVPNLFERIDDPLYPPEALREALANALCHRDYGAGGGSIGIAIFDDRLEISSTGPLPFGQTVDDLKKPHPSQPWNPKIARTFYRRGIIETWGRGTIKMIELTTEAGLTPPEFEATRHEVIVRFRPTRYQAPTRVSVDLTPLQRQVLEVLSRRGPSSLSELLQFMQGDASERTVQDNLQALRQMGQIRLVGRAKSARWILAPPPE